MRNFKVVKVKETTKEIAALYMPKNSRISLFKLNNWLREITNNDMEVTIKSGTFVFEPVKGAEQEYEVIPGELDNGDIRYHVYAVEYVESIKEML